MATTIYLIRPETYPIATSYLLDTYSAVAAYSLRQLKTGVTSVVRVRRSSDNAESDFTATEITDGTLTTWTGANNGFVVTWYDQSGNSADITNATATAQPQLVSSGSVLTKGSLPAVKFDGSNDTLIYSSAGFLQTDPISAFSVTAANTTGIRGVIWSTYGQITRTFHDCTASRDTLGVGTGGSQVNVDLSTTRNDTNQRLLSVFIDNSKGMSSFDNGATGTTATYSIASRNPSSGFQLGAQATVTYLNGYIQEVIAFDTDESANRTAIESDINTHYSIY